MDPKDLMKKETNALTSYVQALGKRESMWEAAKTLIKQGDASVPALVEGLRDPLITMYGQFLLLCSGSLDLLRRKRSLNLFSS
ncbi:hypothetical protein BDD39_003059 [Saccharococcus thermophilus]|uniref:Uncharacterized protein n=1 Tax=Saccharococcus thermophilus TaxID=29396 RepID=A0A846MLL6_9BACL|nr:hypothetical protein [Saccharococcus thermophilus]